MSSLVPRNEARSVSSLVPRPHGNEARSVSSLVPRAHGNEARSVRFVHSKPCHPYSHVAWSTYLIKPQKTEYI